LVIFFLVLSASALIASAVIASLFRVIDTGNCLAFPERSVFSLAAAHVDLPAADLRAFSLLLGL
jgi:hypothetical protein